MCVGSEPRTLAPPERRIAVVSANVALGAYHLISAHDLDGPAEPRPGQFYMLAAAERWGGGAAERPYLPRAFSFARARPGERAGVELDFLLEDIGPGTRRLRELTPGEGLALVGPLGVGFDRPAARTGPLLVGGGIGVAPLLALHDAVIAAGGDAGEVVLGFRSERQAPAGELFGPGAGRDGVPVPVTVCTDDGSAGRRGLVTDPLRERLDRGPAATVYACGPPAMLEAVRALCAERSVPAQLALESGMACGFGACFGCVVPTTEGYVRLCVDGPVLDAAVLDTALVAGAGH